MWNMTWEKPKFPPFAKAKSKCVIVRNMIVLSKVHNLLWIVRCIMILSVLR